MHLVEFEAFSVNSVCLEVIANLTQTYFFRINLIKVLTLWDVLLCDARMDYSFQLLHLCSAALMVVWNRPLCVSTRYAYLICSWKFKIT